jgi:NitT/TauT family transport system substrate-binding protein
LLFNGLDRRDVTIVGLPLESAVRAIEKREVDALAVFEPYAFDAARLLGKDAAILAAPRLNHSTFNLVFDRRLAGSRDADLQKILRALERANRFIREQPLQAQGLLGKRLRLDQPFIDWIWKDYAYELSLDQSLIAVLESHARWAMREGYGDGLAPPNYISLLYPLPLAQLMPSAVSAFR